VDTYTTSLILVPETALGSATAQSGSRERGGKGGGGLTACQACCRTIRLRCMFCPDVDVFSLLLEPAPSASKPGPWGPGLDPLPQAVVPPLCRCGSYDCLLFTGGGVDSPRLGQDRTDLLLFTEDCPGSAPPRN
jgi:hypothetical protein